MPVCLDLHDFSVVHNRLDLLLKLKYHFPNFKVSLFTIPVDKKEDFGPYTIRGSLLDEIKSCLDWIQLIPHGFLHNGSEMRNADYRYFKEVTIPEIKRAFDRDGLPHEKGFCAPHWQWNDGVVQALDELGWWGAIDRDKSMPRTQKFYQYNYLLNEPFWEAKGLLKLHGHIYGTKNDLGKCFENLLKLSKETEWLYATEVLETK